MNNVHPRVLSILTAQLPAGAEIQSVVAETDQAVLTVLIDGEVKQLGVPKTHADLYLGWQQLEVMAEEGDSWETVMEAISKKYRLYLMPGVDYEVDDGVLSFEGAKSLVKTVTLLPTAVTLLGSLNIQVKDKTQYDRPKVALVCDLSEQKTQLALISKVFPTYDVIVVGAGGLGSSLGNVLVEHLQNMGIEYIPDLADVLVTEVVELINDGVSDVAIVKTASDQLWFVRYRLLKASKEKPAAV